MAQRISIGRTWPYTSPIHRLDPRAKILVALAIMISTFTITSLAQVVFSALCIGVLLAATKVPAKVIYRSTKSIFLFLAVIAAFNVFVIKDGMVVASWGPFLITDQGLKTGALYIYRLFALILTGASLLLTTTPPRLTDGFESLLSPLAKLGVPVHEIALVLSLALRFIPTLADEAHQIMEAQACRGASFETGSFASRLRAFIANLIPMFAGAMRHADSLSRALDARGYGACAKRTHWHVMRMEARDFMFIGLGIAYLAVLHFI